MLDSVAKDFVDIRFAKMNGVLGVLLIGSASLDYVDELSDVDLEVIVTRDLFCRVGEFCGSEQYRGINVWWEWTTLNELKNTLNDWEDDLDLWVYSKSKILHDSKHRIAHLLADYRQYPKKIWLEKLFVYWYFATGNAPYDSGKAIQRGDLVTAQLYFNQAMEYYTSLIFILNNSFVPYRKWRLKELNKLAYKPENYEEILRQILTIRRWTLKEFETKQHFINELIGSFEKKLLNAGVPEQKLKDPWKFKITFVPRV
jgi:hypothetical protein